jgi:ABC-2 type transport system permease protein
MNAQLTHTLYMTVRDLRRLARQPWYVAITLVQPVIYLLLFGALFQRVVQLPGFGASSYITFLLPGVVVMTALFSAGWNGMSTIEDLDRGVMDRFLVSPVRRSSLITGRIVQLAVVAVIQSAIIVALGWIRGADFPNGLVGIAILVSASVLLAAAFGSLSNGLALIARKEESLIGAVQFVTLPLTFMAAIFMAQALMPSWMQYVATYNPVNWAVQAGRQAMSVATDWSVVWSRLGYLTAFAVVSAWLATRAFRAYQRSV